MRNDNVIKHHVYLFSENLSDKIKYLDFMLDFYHKVICVLNKDTPTLVFREQMSTSLLMMYSKGMALRNLVVSFSNTPKCGFSTNIVDHTILFTLVRTAYEQLCAFELVYIIPDTDEKRKIMENVYVAAGLVNRQKTFSEEMRSQYKEAADEDKRDIDNCRNEIRNTHLFQSLTEKEQKTLEKTVFKEGKYQIVFTEDGKFIPNVSWDEVRKYSRLSTDALYGIYKYACNMTHPSYLGLIQFHDAYKEGGVEIINITAVVQMIGILSLFIMDYLEEFQEYRYVYMNLDEQSKYMIRAYYECFRDNNIKKE